MMPSLYSRFSISGRRRASAYDHSSPQPYTLNPKPSFPAFTLLEVTLVIGLLVIITAMAWPNLARRMTARQLPESANNLRAALRMARATAGFTGRRHRIRFTYDNQAPQIQYEIDPTLQGGTWKTTADDWAQTPILLGDVQVTKIIPGRPVYLTPVSYSAASLEDADSNSTEESEDALSSAIGDGGLGSGGDSSASGDKVDADGVNATDRPDIVFDVSGGSNWYTIILSRVPPGQKVSEKEEQLWIILDGRTGLPQIQQPLTKEQLADSTIRPDLDLLQPPDADLDDLSLSDAGSSLAGDVSNDSTFGGPSDSLDQGGDSSTVDQPTTSLDPDADPFKAAEAAMNGLNAGQSPSGDSTKQPRAFNPDRGRIANTADLDARNSNNRTPRTGRNPSNPRNSGLDNGSNNNPRNPRNPPSNNTIRNPRNNQNPTTPGNTRTPTTRQPRNNQGNSGNPSGLGSSGGSSGNNTGQNNPRGTERNPPRNNPRNTPRLPPRTDSNSNSQPKQ